MLPFLPPSPLLHLTQHHVYFTFLLNFFSHSNRNEKVDEERTENKTKSGKKQNKRWLWRNVVLCVWMWFKCLHIIRVHSPPATPAQVINLAHSVCCEFDPIKRSGEEKNSWNFFPGMNNTLFYDVRRDCSNTTCVHEVNRKIKFGVLTINCQGRY